MSKYKIDITPADSTKKTLALQEIAEAVKNLELNDILNIFAGSLINTAKANGITQEKMFEFLTRCVNKIYLTN